MKKFISDVKSFWNYTGYSASADLKSEVAGSFLSWLWWILDPLLFMLVYSFVAVTVFRSSEPYFPVFVFIGLNTWNFFARTVKGCVKLVASKKSIVTKVYVPKHIFILEKMAVYGFKMLVSFALTVVLMIIYRVPVSFRVLWLIPLWILLVIITFAVSTIVAHFGVFVEDLLNIITVVLQLGFYLSGVFFSLEKRISNPVLQTLLVKCNPLALIITDTRNILLYNSNPHYFALLAWFIVGLALAVLGIHIIYKYENSYVKVI